jgi:cob(I)alamin adenosyltransferase
MVTINKVYTRTGDKGETSLVGGRRLAKDHLRIESYGTVDELNAIVGIARSLILEQKSFAHRQQTGEVLQGIQQKLFDLGSELATHAEDFYEGQIKAVESDVKWLEQLIDTLNAKIEPLKSFVLPGGNLINAHLHQARTVCRRAERLVIRFSKDETTNPYLIKFLNRLSDLFFVLARWVSHELKVPETLWQPNTELPVFQD